MYLLTEGLSVCDMHCKFADLVVRNRLHTMATQRHDIIIRNDILKRILLTQDFPNIIHLRVFLQIT